jgi:GTP cyclohydrolase II/3,4-dihydroxy 2-butanone 4-phosphate synthase/GTP cyclohydrolase II
MSAPIIHGPVVTRLPVDHRGREVDLEAYAYRGERDCEQILALVRRAPDADRDAVPIVRLHSGCVTGDVFHSLRCDCYQQLRLAMDLICEAAVGAIIYLPYQEGRGIGLYQKLRAYSCQDRGSDTIEANVEIGMPVDARDYGLAAAVLRDLNFSTVNLLSGNPLKKLALTRNEIHVAQCIPLKCTPNQHNNNYLTAKRVKMAHDL